VSTSSPPNNQAGSNANKTAANLTEGVPSVGFSPVVSFRLCAGIVVFLLVTAVVYLSLFEAFEAQKGTAGDAFKSGHISSVAPFALGISAFIVAGIITSAPLLSLALHQFHDVVFQLFLKSADAKDSDAAKSYKAILTLLRNKVYGLLNECFFGVWFSAICLLIVILITFAQGCFEGGSAPASFAMAALCVAIGYVSIYATIAFAFFLVVKPGANKINLYISYMETWQSCSENTTTAQK
jgi:hypothetical protein